MEISFDIDEELLCEFDRAARSNNITRNTAVRGAITTWVSQARRDATLRELFDAEFDPEARGEDRLGLEKPTSSDSQKVPGYP